MPGEAEGIVADPVTGLVAVGIRDPDLLLLFDGASGELRERVRLGESVRHLQLAAPGGPVLGTGERSDELFEVALPGGEVRSTAVGDFPHDAALAADGRIFVGDEGGDTISVVRDREVVETLPAPEQPGGVAAVRRRIGVIAVAERVLALYDPFEAREIARLDAGVGPTHLVAGEDDRLYVTDTQGDAVLVFETSPELRLLDRANVSDSPYGIAYDAGRNALWVTRTGRNEVVEMPITERAPRRARTFATVRQPNTVAVDSRSGRVYIAGRVDGELQIIDPDAEDR